MHCLICKTEIADVAHSNSEEHIRRRAECIKKKRFETCYTCNVRYPSSYAETHDESSAHRYKEKMAEREEYYCFGLRVNINHLCC